jgi:hypothetical protein
MDTRQPQSSAEARWQQACLHRLHRLLELTPESAPAGLDEMEALALLEWSRMAVYADCHAAGVGQPAQALLRGSLRRRSTLT